MTEPSVPLLDLSEEDVQRLPEPLRAKAFCLGDGPTAKARYTLVKSASVKHAALLRRAVAGLPRLAALQARKASEEKIEQFLALLYDDDERAPVDLDIEIDNAAMRAEYLKATPTLTSAQIHKMSGAAAKNASETASRWKREKKVFSVPFKGTELYPAFQFADGAPRPAIKRILAELPDDLSPWQVALWFSSGNGWLKGKTPRDLLVDRAEEVVTAAERLADPAVG